MDPLTRCTAFILSFAPPYCRSQDPKNGCIALFDAKLAALFGQEKAHVLAIRSLVFKHLTPVMSDKK